MPEQSKCSSCGAQIIWAVTENGRRMPVDAQKQKRVLLEFDNPREDPTVPPVARVVDTWVSHFVTCPEAAKHRKAR